MKAEKFLWGFLGEFFDPYFPRPSEPPPTPGVVPPTTLGWVPAAPRALKEVWDGSVSEIGIVPWTRRPQNVNRNALLYFRQLQQNSS